MVKEASTKTNNTGLAVKIVVLVAAFVVCAILVLMPQTQTSVDEPDPGFVVFHSYPEGSQQAEYIEKTAINSVKKRQPGLAASVAYYSENEMYDQVLRARNEGKLPDIIFLAPETMAGLAQLGALAKLDEEEGPSGVPGITGIPWPIPEENAMAGTIGGERFGLPSGVSVQVLLYNQEILSSAGIAPPTDLGAFWSVLEAIDNGGGMAGFVLPGAGMKSLAPFVWSSGGELVREDGKKAYGYLNDARNTAVFDRRRFG